MCIDIDEYTDSLCTFNVLLTAFLNGHVVTYCHSDLAVDEITCAKIIQANIIQHLNLISMLSYICIIQIYYCKPYLQPKSKPSPLHIKIDMPQLSS